MSEWVRVASLGKAKNLKGGLLAYPCEGLPFLLAPGMEVVFVPPLLRTPRSGRVENISHQAGEAYLVQFDTIDSIDLAERLQDRFCLVRRTALPEGWDAGKLDPIGFTLIDPEGTALATVVAHEDNPAHPLLVVCRTSDAQTARIPLVEDFIVSIDEEAKTITMALPDGLLDL